MNMFENVKRAVDVEAVCRELLPDGKRKGSRWVARNPTRDDKQAGSFGVTVSGPRAGMWFDFSTNDGGSDAISLWAYCRGVSQSAAAREIAERFSADAPAATKRAPEPKPAPPSPVFVVPESAPAPPTHPDLGPADVVYTYRTRAGRAIMHVMRWGSGKAKQIRPLTWDGSRWQWRGIPQGSPTPLYGLERLGADERPVLMLEGEKDADRAHLMLGDRMACMCWLGGASAVDRAKLSELQGRAVTLWPDDDEPGRAAMVKIGARLIAIGCYVAVVNTRDHAPGWDFSDAADEGADIAEMLANAREVDAPAQPEQPATAPAPAPGFIGFPDVDDKSRPLATIENLAALLDAHGVRTAYNLMTHRAEVHVPGRSYTDENADLAALAEVKSKCAKHALSTTHVAGYMLALSDASAYHPIVDWIETAPWDGVDRWDRFLATIPFDGDASRVGLSHRLVRRWMISATRAAYSRDGLSTHGVLVFQGPQGRGKTRWIKRLCPLPQAIRDGVQLDLRSKDSIIGATSAWITELGELDGSMRKNHGATLKAFLTLDRDNHRRPYAETETRAGRRTVFAATVNDGVFLADPTGSRRFWVVPVRADAFDHDHDLPMQQVWAQVRTWDVAGEQHWLADDEAEALAAANQAFTAPDVAEDLLLDRYDVSCVGVGWVSAASVAERLVDRVDHAFLTALAIAMRKHNIERKQIGGRALWNMPPLKGDRS